MKKTGFDQSVVMKPPLKCDLQCAGDWCYMACIYLRTTKLCF